MNVLKVFFFFICNGLLFAQALIRVEAPEELPYVGNLSPEKRKRLLEGIEQSLLYLQRPSSKYHYPKENMTRSRVRDSLLRFQEILEGPLTGEELDILIKKEFDFYLSAGSEGKRKVLFTGYFEPLYEGSRVRTDVFRHPLYRVPPDLLLDKKGKVIGRKTENGMLVPYWTREDIDHGKKLTGMGLEIVYLKDLYEAYMAHFQGSVSVKLPSGEMIRLGYAARNHATKGFSLPKELLKDGVLAKNQLLPDTIRLYFRTNPEELPKYLYRNTSYVFFTERKEGPWGSMSIRVTPTVTLSLDHLFPKGGICFVDFPWYRHKKKTIYREFALNQDTGGAIRGPGRCEIFFGTGREAEVEANDLFCYGKLYFLFLKTSY